MLDLVEHAVGTFRAPDRSMAAVLALIMVPLLAALCLLAVVTQSESTLTSGVAMAMVTGLGAFVRGGALRFVREEEQRP